MRRIAVASIVLVLALPLVARATETRIHRADLPPQVRNTLQLRYPGARPIRYHRVKRGSITTYRAELQFRAQRIDVRVGSRGKWLDESAEIRLAETPAAVRKAFEWHTSRGYVPERVRQITAHDRRALRYQIVARGPDGARELLYESSGALVRSDALAGD